MGALEDSGPITPTGTDMDEYKQWVESQGGQGIGEMIFNDVDDARDAAEFAELSGATAESITE